MGTLVIAGIKHDASFYDALWRSAPLYRGLERVSKRKSDMQGSGNADFMPTQHNVIEKQQAMRTVFSLSYKHS